jgi:hypothetical protein
MLISELKPQDEILGILGQKESVFLVGCSGCAEVCDTGGEASVAQMADDLTAQGKAIAGSVNIDFLCSKALAGTRLRRRLDTIAAADAALVLSCGIGVQVVATLLDTPTFPATNTVSVGGHQGVWRGEERCGQCGDCVLHLTGGICPVTFCSKSMMNGPCGGYSSEGMCEVDPEMPCGWVKIYQRLDRLDRLDDFRKIVSAKKHWAGWPPARLRNTTIWAVEETDLPGELAAAGDER